VSERERHDGVQAAVALGAIIQTMTSAVPFEVVTMGEPVQGARRSFQWTRK
jgi:hypothetical protein